MSFSAHKKYLGVAAGAAAFTLLVSACAGGSDDTDDTTNGATETSATSDEPITLTLATFNQFGYSAESEGGADYAYDLIAEYEELHPNVDVVYNVADTSNTARENFFTKLGPGGLADIEAIEVDWLPETMQYADLLADLSNPEIEGNWLDWKTAAATDSEGRLIAYGTDIGPEAICYNVDAFEAAGLPTDPAEVAAELGDWESFFDLGRQYADATGKGFYEENAAVLQGMIGQIEAPYEDPATGEIIALDNAEVKAMYDLITAASEDGVSAGYEQWGGDWSAALASGDIAVTLCPAWFLGVIEGNAPEGNWDIANAFPNGGGNWGGSYLVVPASGENVEAATELAAWLTAPEQQAKAFENVGAFPSAPAASESDAVQNYTRAFFNDAPAGQIFTDRAAAVAVSPFKGEYYFQVNDAMVNALRRVDEGIMTPAESWAQFEADVQAIG